MKIVHLLLVFTTILSTIQITFTANILFYFPISVYSNRVAVWPLVEILAEKGHNVTFLSGLDPLNKNPKVHEYTPQIFNEINQLPRESPLSLRLRGAHEEAWGNIPYIANLICEKIVQDSEIREWIKNTKFDLIFLGAFFNECGLSIAYLHKSKFIIYSPTSALSWFAEDFGGHVPETSWIPELDIQLPNKMSFLDRVYNTLRPLYWRYWRRRWSYFPDGEKIVRKNLDIPDMPDFADMLQKTSLIFLNSHYSFEFARSLPPLYVSVGGLHIKKSNAVLSQELSEFIERSGEDGFIYFSFGSVTKASTFSPALLQTFYNVFRKFKTARVVWSFDMDRPEDMPENVYTVKWAPQNAILGHKKIKGFITQGGIMSLQEAIHFEVPVIVFPFFGDQDSNANLMERHGCGIKVEIRGLDEEKLQTAISSILTDHSYKARILKISRIFKDRIGHPLDTALWWTEFVLRNNNTSFLKPLTANQTWYEMRLLDVWLFIFSSIFVVFLGVVFLIKTIISRVKKPVEKLKRL